MPIPVCIVLNVREPEKAQACESLRASLAASGIESNTLECSPGLEKRIKALKPDAVVLDYLLGDYSTGVDILDDIFSEGDENPDVFFLTDEPSIQVAVTALRKGARHYFELSNPESISLLSREIKTSLRDKRLRSRQAVRGRGSRPVLSIDSLAATSEKMRRTVLSARVLIEKGTAVTVISGPGGSGKLTLARAMHGSDPAAADKALIEIDLATFCGEAREWEFLRNPQSEFPVIIKNAEYDLGDFLSLVTKTGPLPDGFRLYVCTSSEQSAKTWMKAVPGTGRLTLPALSERLQDLPQLLHDFTAEAFSLCPGRKLPQLRPEHIEWAKGRDWPANLRQLRSVTIDSLVAASLSSADLGESLSMHYENWPAEEPADNTPAPDALVAALTLEACNHNFRRASAALGCSPLELARLLGLSTGAQAGRLK